MISAKLLFIILFSYTQLHTLDFWLCKHIAPLSTTEQELLLCTLDAAIKRCQATLKVQDLSEQLVEFVHQETQFIAETRLQPAKCNTTLDTHDEIMQQWFHQKELYKNSCIFYDHYVSQVDTQPHLLEAFNYVRHEARSAVLKATAYESYRLKDCVITLNEYGQKALTSIQVLHSLIAKRSIVDDITQWFASLLVMPFKQCNDQITILNDQSWQLVNKQQMFGNYVWRTIEEARIQIYQHYYYALALHLKKTKVVNA
jgi:hypothetical protein